MQKIDLWVWLERVLCLFVFSGLIFLPSCSAGEGVETDGELRQAVSTCGDGTCVSSENPTSCPRATASSVETASARVPRPSTRAPAIVVAVTACVSPARLPAFARPTANAATGSAAPARPTRSALRIATAAMASATTPKRPARAPRTANAATAFAKDRRGTETARATAGAVMGCAAAGSPRLAAPAIALPPGRHIRRRWHRLEIPAPWREPPQSTDSEPIPTRFRSPSRQGGRGWPPSWR